MNKCNIPKLGSNASCPAICNCRRRKEEQEAKRLVEMEEAALQVEEKYSGLAEEADQKTKKLKKLWKKFQEVPRVNTIACFI